jgi:hypothetical protein
MAAQSRTAAHPGRVDGLPASLFQLFVDVQADFNALFLLVLLVTPVANQARQSIAGLIDAGILSEQTTGP